MCLFVVLPVNLHLTQAVQSGAAAATAGVAALPLHSLVGLGAPTSIPATVDGHLIVKGVKHPPA